MQKNKRILLVVDAQYDFMMPNGKLYVPGAEQLIVPMIELLATANEKYAAVLFTMDWHEKEEYAKSEEAKEFDFHCDSESYGSMLVLPIASVENAYMAPKSVFDFWSAPENIIGNLDGDNAMTRDEWFDQYKGATADVIGVALDYCVKYAVDGLLARGYEVNVIKELTKAINE